MGSINEDAIISAEVENTNTNNVPEDASSKKSNDAKFKSVAFLIVSTVVETMAAAARTADQGEVRAAMRKVLTTLFALSALDEYALGLRIDQDLWRYNDYIVPASLASLLAPRKVVVRDVASAFDLLARDKFMTGLNRNDVLRPSDFGVEWRKVCSKLRINVQGAELSRPSVELLADATKYAINGRKVPDRNAAKVVFLKQSFDDEACIDIVEWAKNFALKLMS